MAINDRALSSEFKLVMRSKRRKSYKFASNVRRKNNFLQKFLKESCTRCMGGALFDGALAGTKLCKPTPPGSWRKFAKPERRPLIQQFTPYGLNIAFFDAIQPAPELSEVPAYNANERSGVTGNQCRVAKLATIRAIKKYGSN